MGRRQKVGRQRWRQGRVKEAIEVETGEKGGGWKGGVGEEGGGGGGGGSRGGARGG